MNTNNNLPLTPAAFHILLSLADSERHGYGIIQDVRLLSSGSVQLGPGTLYGTIKRLLAEQLVEESDSPAEAPQDDERRRYYRLTSNGRLAVEAEARRLEQIVKVARARRLLPAETTG